MRSLFTRRRQEHLHDEKVRQETVDAMVRHRRTLTKVRSTLAGADETLAQEIKRLDSALRRHEARGI